MGQKLFLCISAFQQNIYLKRKFSLVLLNVSSSYCHALLIWSHLPFFGFLWNSPAFRRIVVNIAMKNTLRHKTPCFILLPWLFQFLKSKFSVRNNYFHHKNDSPYKSFVVRACVRCLTWWLLGGKSTYELQFEDHLDVKHIWICIKMMHSSLPKIVLSFV